MPRPTVPAFGLAPISATDCGVSSGARRCAVLVPPRSWFIAPCSRPFRRAAFQSLQRRAFAIGFGALLGELGFEAALHFFMQRPVDLQPELAVGRDDQ